MGQEKKRFSDTRFYPIFFMIIVSIIFVGILATFYELTAPKVKAYQQESNQRTILGLFGLPLQAPQQAFDKFIEQKQQNGVIFYEAMRQNKLLGYAFPIRGKGLWGTIDAVVAVSSDFTKIIAFDVIKQNETPGLGGRITEKQFKEQFQNKDLLQNNELVKYNLVAEDAVIDEYEISQITGATLSSRAVVDMLYNELKDIKKSLGVSYE